MNDIPNELVEDISSLEPQTVLLIAIDGCGGAGKSTYASKLALALGNSQVIHIDDFYKAFLAEMIVHHQGAIDMADLALQKSNRPELRTLANDIIATQTNEINQMKAWQQQWGYSVSSGSANSTGGEHMMH